MATSVSTSALPCAGMVVGLEAYTSYPAANSDPRVGARPAGERSLICKLGRPAGFVAGDVVVDMLVAVRCFFAGAGVDGESGCLSVDVEISVRGGVDGSDIDCFFWDWTLGVFVFCSSSSMAWRAV